MWILKTFPREISFFYLPGLFSIALAILFPDLGEVSLLYAFIATAFIDSGHVYTTLWRTYFHADERKSHWGYVVWPVFFCVLFTLWYYFSIPGLWSFVVYSTLYHHVRQFYGYSKWYQGLNRVADKNSDYYLYTFALVPILAYHFRTNVVLGYYSEKDLFSYPDENIFIALKILWILIFVSWIVRERKIWTRGRHELNRLLSVAFPALIYAYCFFIGRTLTQVLFPLLFVHGISYFGVMGQSLERTQTNRFRSQWIALAAVLITAIIFGPLESWFEENATDVVQGLPGMVTALMIGLSLTPLYCHYAFDALIWRRSHREASVVFQR